MEEDRIRRVMSIGNGGRMRRERKEEGCVGNGGRKEEGKCQ